MTEQQREIRDNNALLAVFIGYIDNGCSQDGFLIHPTTNHDIDIKSLDYDTDWSMLMQVVERIEDIKEGRQLLFEVGIHGCESWVEAHDSIPADKRTILIEQSFCTEKTKIEAVYYACIAFVRWYNENYK